MPKAVVFDLGNVLLNFDFCRASSALAPHCELAAPEILTLINQSPLLHRYESGKITTEAFFEVLRREARFKNSLEEFEPLFADIFDPVPEMIDLHRRLRAASIPTYIFSNTNDLAIRYISRTYPFYNTFTGYVLSYQHGCMKPNPPIYAAVEQLTNLQGSDLLYLDDRPENIDTARTRCWQTILHSNPAESIPIVEQHFPSLIKSGTIPG